jgi:hypothetical protein
VLRLLVGVSARRGETGREGDVGDGDVEEVEGNEMNAMRR